MLFVHFMPLVSYSNGKMLMLKYILVLFYAVIVSGQDVASRITSTTPPSMFSIETAIKPKMSIATISSSVVSSSILSVTSSPSTSPQPSTTSIPKLDYWFVEENGTFCILARVDIKLDLKLNSHTKDIAIVVPKDAKANGTCGENNQSLILSWDLNKLLLVFKENEKTDKYYLGSVEVVLNADNQTIKLADENITMFETSLNHSYLCSYSDPLKIKDINESIHISFSNIKLEAFNSGNSTSFSEISSCPPDTPDIVPIVVGCALTVLVVVVLIAYLVGRRNTQTGGYLSM